MDFESANPGETAFTPSPDLRLCHNASNHLDVMLSESEASAFPTGYEKADSSAVHQNDILTQSLWRAGARV
jgi:hypothetical protein